MVINEMDGEKYGKEGVEHLYQYNSAQLTSTMFLPETFWLGVTVSMPFRVKKKLFRLSKPAAYGKFVLWM